MKKLLAAIFVALLMVGGGEEEIKVHTEYYENGQKKMEGNLKGDWSDGLWTFWYENGQKESEGNFKDGTPVDLWTYWYGNGQKQREKTYKDGKTWSAVVWKPNGEKCPVTNVVNGSGVEIECWTKTDILFVRGKEWADFLINHIRIRISFPLPLAKNSKMLLEAAEVVLFDTGDLWKLASELKAHITPQEYSSIPPPTP